MNLDSYPAKDHQRCDSAEIVLRTYRKDKIEPCAEDVGFLSAETDGMEGHRKLLSCSGANDIDVGAMDGARVSVDLREPTRLEGS